MKYIKSLLVFTLLFLVSFGVKALDIPEADVTYTNDWENTLTIDTNITIKLVNIIHDNVDSGDAAIKITNNATVNIVFEGNNTLTARSNVIGAGIQVDEGSTLNLFGLNNSTLTVYGGQYSAGIGGKGYSGIAAANAKAGNINIYSGKIIAHGGIKGAGIGSGYHSSASDIHIYGGDIEAYGKGSGAGIGSGYGTSGGTGDAAGTGYYNGGNITIEGGTVKAATYNYDFTKFNQYDLNTLYDENYQDTMAAGIGGGYGASSGVIIIGGSANVIALGNCGGAGIGSGRGATKIQNYDVEKYFVDVTIKDNANVVALTTDDRRTTVDGDNGGAAIGHGRGATLEGTPNGSVKILDKATVYAVGSYHTQAIGGSSVVEKFIKDENNNIIEPTTAKLQTLEISKNATVVAISDGYVSALDNDKVKNLISLNLSKEFLQKAVFNYAQFPFEVKAFNKDNDKNNVNFTIQNRNGTNIIVQLPKTSEYNFSTKYQGYYLANNVEKNMALFKSDVDSIKEYDITTFTKEYIVDQNIDVEYGSMNIKAIIPVGVFDAYIELDVDQRYVPAEWNAMFSKLDEKYQDNYEKFIVLDIDVGNEERIDLSEPVNILFQIPEEMNPDRVRLLFITDEEDEIPEQEIVEIDGVKYLSVMFTHFSQYQLFEFNEYVELTTVPNTIDDITSFVALFVISLTTLIIISIKMTKKASN